MPSTACCSARRRSPSRRWKAAKASSPAISTRRSCRGRSPPDAMPAEIILFCERKKWHGRSISRAFRARGIRPLTISLAACGFSTAAKTGLAIPGLGDNLPKGALVLFVPGGSFEQVTLYLGVLHALREQGGKVWNDARAIERCVDKSTTTFFLQRAGLPTPRTFAGANRAEAEAVAASLLAEGHKLVQKPLFGAQGK